MCTWENEKHEKKEKMYSEIQLYRNIKCHLYDQDTLGKKEVVV